MTAPQEVLQDGFARFVHAAEELEASYASLRQRAASVDDELQQTNAKLEQALAERDGMFAALPIGLVLVRADGREVGASNVEADRLVEAPLRQLRAGGHAEGALSGTRALSRPKAMCGN